MDVISFTVSYGYERLVSNRHVQSSFSVKPTEDTQDLK